MVLKKYFRVLNYATLVALMQTDCLLCYRHSACVKLLQVLRHTVLKLASSNTSQGSILIQPQLLGQPATAACAPRRRATAPASSPAFAGLPLSSPLFFVRGFPAWTGAGHTVSAYIA